MKWKERGMVSMINKDYFKYLIKQNKKYLILIYVVGIIIPFLTLNSLIPDPYIDYQIARIPGMISLIYGFALSCIVPIYLFSFFNRSIASVSSLAQHCGA